MRILESPIVSSQSSSRPGIYLRALDREQTHRLDQPSSVAALVVFLVSRQQFVHLSPDRCAPHVALLIGIVKQFRCPVEKG